MNYLCGQNREVIFAVIYVLTLLVERWLGRTSKVKPGSLLDGLIALVKLIFRRTPNGKS